MPSTSRARHAPDQIDGNNVREPPLRVVGFPAADRYAPATPDDTVYALARFAWHHSRRLDEPAGSALLAQWPRVKGRHPTRHDDAMAALAVDWFCVRPSDVAAPAAWCLQPDSANGKIKRGRSHIGTGAAMRPGLQVVTGDHAARLLEGAEPLPEPRDPADLLHGLLSVEASPAEIAETRRRFADAAGLGLPERVTLDVVLPAGTFTVEGIPTSSREAAWAVIDRAAQEHGGYTPGLGPMFTSALDDEHARRFAAWLLAERREFV